MNRTLVISIGTVAVALTTRVARADDPVVISYVAPNACASPEAFRALVGAQVGRTPNPDRPWRFEVVIRNDGDYVGTLKTENGLRELRAPTCDEVTAALALVIAMSEPELPSTPPPPSPTLSPSPPPSLTPPPSRDRVSTPSESTVDWRIGARLQNWNDGSELSATGGTLTLSTEVPFGFPKMLFEVGATLLFSRDTRVVPLGVMPIATTPDQWLMVDAQTCPIDLPIAQTGLAVLGCAHVAVGSIANVGLAGYAGAGGRLRWQTPWRIFFETHFDGLYGTRINGIPALMDLGGSVGFRI